MKSTSIPRFERSYFLFPMAFLASLTIAWNAEAQRTIAVDTTADELDITPNANCSLREAIATANSTAATPTDVGGCNMVGSDGDITINVPDGTYTLTLTGVFISSG